MSFNPGVSGIGGATDVAVSVKQDNQVLTYDATVDKWRNEVVVAANVSDLAEAVRDTVAAALVAGSNITITPNDGSNTITISSTGGGSGTTDLGVTRSTTNVIVTSSTGADATIPAASATDAGVLTPATLSRIDDVEAAVDGIATVPISSFAGQIEYDQLPAGMVLFVAYTSANASSVSRPTSRTDIQVRWRGPASNPPAAMIAGVDVIDDTGA